MKTLVTILFAVLLLSADLATAQWVPVGLPGRGIRDIAVGNNSMFVVTSDSGSVYRSTNRGDTWELVFPARVSAMTVTRLGTIFVNAHFYWPARDTLFRSTDNGLSWMGSNSYQVGGTWVLLNNSPTGAALCIRSGEGTEAYRSTDEGFSWTFVPMVDTNITDMAFFGNGNILTCGHIIPWMGKARAVGLISTDDGVTWSTTRTPPPLWRALAIGHNGTIFNGGGVTSPHFCWGRLYCSSDTCATWTQVSTIFPSDLLALPSGGIVAGTDSNGFFLFSDNGDSLGTRNQGLTNLQVRVLALGLDGYVYAGTGSGVWRRPLSEMTTDVESERLLPTHFVLEQNYPNPFNPSTTISYQLPTQSHITLKVFDLLGREVATLVDGIEQAGYKSVQWNASNFASGVYFYHLTAGRFIETRRCAVMK